MDLLISFKLLARLTRLTLPQMLIQLELMLVHSSILHMILQLRHILEWDSFMIITQMLEE